MQEKRKRGRPPKDPAGRRTEKINTYVSAEVSDALHAEAEARGMTISELVATVLEGHVFGDKKEVQHPPVSKDAVYAVVKLLAEEGLLRDSILGANLAPEIITSANLSPKTFAPASDAEAEKEEEQRGVNSDTRLAPKTKQKAVIRGKQGGEEP
jgi:hypothetical protein